VLLTASWLIWLLERHARGSNITSYPKALWWAMETITTVGYGDHHPVTGGGRLVAAGLMVVGLALVGVITATVVTWFFSELELVRDVRAIAQEEHREEATLAAVLDQLERIEARIAALEPVDADHDRS
jgi:voltage-gated potassium channel